MLPKYHIFLGFIFILFLYFFFPQISLLGLVIIFISSILIDIDHYLYYIFKKKDLNPYNAYVWHIKEWKRINKLPRKQRKTLYTGFYLFHGIELLIILLLLGIYINYFFIFIFIGFSFHLITDIIHEIYFKETIDKISLIWSYFRWKKIN